MGSGGKEVRETESERVNDKERMRLRAEGTGKYDAADEVDNCICVSSATYGQFDTCSYLSLE